MTFDFSGGIRGQKVAYGIFDEELPDYMQSIRAFDKKLANQYLINALTITPEVRSSLLIDIEAVREGLRADWLKKNPFSSLPDFFYPKPSPFVFDPAALHNSRYIVGCDPIALGLDFNMGKDKVGILRRSYSSPAHFGPSPLIEAVWMGASQEARTKFSEEFKKQWLADVVNAPFMHTKRPPVPPVAWKELCVVNGYIIQTAEAYPSKYRIVLAPDTDFIPPHARRWYLGGLVHRFNSDPFGLPQIVYASQGLADECVTVETTKDAVALTMIGYLIRKVNETDSPYNYQEKPKDPGHGDDTLMALSLAMSASNRGKVTQYTEQQMKDAPDLQKKVADDSSLADLQKAMQASPVGPTIEEQTAGNMPEEKVKKEPRPIISIATRKHGRVVIGVSESHRLVVLVDKVGIPASIRREFIGVLSNDIVKVDKPGFALLEGASVAHTHMLAMRLMQLYRHAPGIKGSAPYWTAKDQHEQAVNPDLKEALSDHILDGAGTVRYEAIYQFNGPAPAPTPLPARRYVAVEIKNTTPTHSTEPTFELTIEVKGGPAWPLATVERTLSMRNPAAMNKLTSPDLPFGAYLTKAAIDKKGSNEVIGIKVTMQAESVLCGPKSAATLAVTHLKKFGPKSDAEDCYFLEADKL
jgi:hypothetical protein